MSDRFGAITLPATALAGDTALRAVGDPALDTLAAYLKAAINADTQKFWEVIHPAILPPETKAVPILRTFTHDPDEGSFSSNALPALFVWRQRFPRTMPFTQDWDEQKSVIAVLWVPPPATLDKRRIRHPFRNAFAKAFGRAIGRERHPAWKVPGDTDPNAATKGSFLLSALKVSKLDILDIVDFDLVVDRADNKQEPFESLLALLDVQELLIAAGDDFDPLTDIRGTVSLQPAIGPALPIDGFQFRPTVLSVTPSSGPASGGTSIVVSGHQYFEDVEIGDLIVTIGGTPCTDVALVDNDTLMAKTPAGAAGAKDVVVTLPSGASSPPLVGGFTHLP